MKKYLRISFLSSAILAVLYTGLWFYQAENIKSLTEKSLIRIAKKIGGNNSDFAYAKSFIGGFPFAIKVNIDQPRFIIDNNNSLYEVSGKNPLILKSNIIGTRFTAQLPEEIKITNLDGDKKQQWRLKYNDSAIFKVRTTHEDTLRWLLNGLKHNLPSPALLIKEVLYKDGGFSINKTTGSEMISSSEGLFLKIKSGRNAQSGQAFDLMAEIKNANLDELIYFSDHDKMLGKINLSTDISYSGYQAGNESNINFRGFNLSSDIFDINIQGMLANSADEAIPQGELRVRLGQYSNIIDYQRSIINYVVQNSAFPIFNIKDEQSDAFKDFLKSISAERYNNEQDILILLKRKKGQELQIGKHGFFEVLKLFRNTFSDSKK